MSDNGILVEEKCKALRVTFVQATGRSARAIFFTCVHAHKCKIYTWNCSLLFVPADKYQMVAIDCLLVLRILCVYGPMYDTSTY